VHSGISQSPLRFALAGAVAALLILPATGSRASYSQQKTKPRHPQQLDSNTILARDPASGEMKVIERAEPAGSGAPEVPSAPATMKLNVNLVPVTCNVFDQRGNSVTGLKAENFKVFEDGASQPLAYFDAATQPASVALVVDASPSVLPDASAVQTSAESLAQILSARDEISVVAFSAHSFELLPFSNDRTQLKETIQKIDVRALFGDVGGSNIYATVFLVAEKLFRGRSGRKAILLFTDGQDSGMGLRLKPRPLPPGVVAVPPPKTAAPPTPEPTPKTSPKSENSQASAVEPVQLNFDDVVRVLSKNGIEVYVVSTQNRPRILTEQWMAAHASSSLLTEASRNAGIPAYTLFLAELVRQAGGELYFLPEMADRRGFERIASNIHTQYSLGFYPESEKSLQPGWHQLRVEVSGSPSATASELIVRNRPSFYVSPK
jgi:VWFA-related protein